MLAPPCSFWGSWEREAKSLGPGESCRDSSRVTRRFVWEKGMVDRIVWALNLCPAPCTERHIHHSFDLQILSTVSSESLVAAA